MGFLRVDYDRAIAQAKKLEQAAALCSNSLADLRRERNNSEGFWIGESGNAMRMQAAAAEKELLSAKEQLTAIASNIRRVAEELRKKDEEMRHRIEIFK